MNEKIELRDLKTNDVIRRRIIQNIIKLWPRYMKTNLGSVVYSYVPSNIPRILEFCEQNGIEVEYTDKGEGYFHDVAFEFDQFSLDGEVKHHE